MIGIAIGNFIGHGSSGNSSWAQLIKNFRLLSDGTIYGFLGDTWAISSGNAINTPTVIGGELFTDPGFENWLSATNLNLWYEDVTGTTTINREGTIKNSGTYSARMDLDSTSSGYGIKNTAIANTSGDWLSVSVYCKISTVGANSGFNIYANGVTNSSPLFLPTTSFSKFIFVFPSSKTNTDIEFKRSGSLNSKSLYFDDSSAKVVNFYSFLSLVNKPFSSPDINISASVTLPNGASGGVIARWGSLLNPKSGLVGYLDSGKCFLDKYVNGTRTNLISTAIAYIAGGFVELICSGTDVSLIYNGAIVDVKKTVADAEIINNKYNGIFSTDASVLITDMFCKVNPVTETLPANIIFWSGTEKGLYNITTYPYKWSGLERVSSDRLRLVVAPVRKGNYSLRCEVRPGDTIASGERAELSRPGGSDGTEIHINEASGTHYYAISCFLPLDWQPPITEATSGCLITQLHGETALASSPAFGLEAKDAFYMKIFGGDMDFPAAPLKSYIQKVTFSDGDLRLGVWNDFVYKIVYKKDFTGSVEVWRRNTSGVLVSVAAVANIPTLQFKTSLHSGTIADHYWKTGIYRSNEPAIINILYLDCYTIGTTFNDVVASAF